MFTAHIDAYEDSPGALDNAAGVVVLMLLAEMLSDYQGNMGFEIVAFNGEDHYSAGGQMDYLSRYGGELSKIALVVNLDDLGYKEGKIIPTPSIPARNPLRKKTEENISTSMTISFTATLWFQGDHMIFGAEGISLPLLSLRNL